MEKIESSGFADKALLLISLLIFGAGITFFYLFENEIDALFRALGLVAFVAVGLAVFLRTDSGKNVIGLLGGARGEVRKMVWPKRQEVIQMTLTVMIAVIIVGVFLWLLDTLFLWLTGVIIGR